MGVAAAPPPHESFFGTGFGCPCRDLIGLLDILPSHKWLGYFRLSLRDKEADAS
jgi:hypothetical protein